MSSRPPMIKAMQVHFWGDACDLTGSVEKIIDVFAQTADPRVSLSVASLGPRRRSFERHSRRYFHFTRSRLRNLVLNKVLKRGGFIFADLPRIIEAERPDLLHFHNRPEQVDPIVRRLTYRPRVICQYHRDFGRFLVPEAADMLIVVSDFVGRKLKEATGTGKPIRVVHNPVPVAVRTIPESLPGKEDVTLLFAGGRQDHKGFPEFLEAIRTLDASDSRLSVKLCGPKLEGYVPPDRRIENLGYLRAQEFAETMEASDVVVMPSRSEGFALAPLEAVARGKLLVATQAGGLAELVSEKNAIVVPTNDAPALSRALDLAIRLIRTGGEPLRQVLTNAHETVSALSPTRVTARLTEVYLEACEPRQN